MTNRKNILILVGSAGRPSSNLQLAQAIQGISREAFTIMDELAQLPHFDPALSATDPPEAVRLFRQKIELSDGVVICTPEYIFSLPAVLKNAFEWCVATTVFAQKTTGLITASANGEKAHEELLLIMKTLEATYTAGTTLLIRGIKSRFDREGRLNDAQTEAQLRDFVSCFETLLRS